MPIVTIDRVTPKLRLLLTLPLLIVCSGLVFFMSIHLTEKPWVLSLLFLLLIGSLLLPLLKNTLVIDPNNQEIRREAGLVFWWTTRHLCRFPQIQYLKLRSWTYRGSYQSSTGNWIPTSATTRQLSIELSDGKSVILQKLENREAALKLAHSLADIFQMNPAPDEYDQRFRHIKIEREHDVDIWLRYSGFEEEHGVPASR